MSSSADIVVGGSGAGVGKTFAELLEPLRHKDVARFNAIFFRRTTVQITNPGGLWDEASELYPLFAGIPNQQKLRWTFPSGALFKFSHLEHEFTIYEHQGAQYCLIIFDELTHFTKKQFIYMLSRNRSVCGVKPYVRSSCNPDPDSFVADMIEWWIDQDERLENGELNPRYGYPIPERIGVIRYFLVDNDEFVWGDTKEEVISKCPHIFENPANQVIDAEHFVKSLTFIPGSIYENKKLIEKNPEYLGNLMALDEVEKIRLLGGNWKIKIDPNCLFNAKALTDMFSNVYPSNTNQRYITCDAARFGQDLETIWIWYGWKVVKLIILSKSDAQETVDVIEKERERYAIPKGKVIVDQDGVGGGVVKLGGYIGFSGDAPPLEDAGTRNDRGEMVKENYKNRKTQFYYRYAEKVNNDEVSMALSTDNVYIDGYPGLKIKLKGRMYDVRDLIKQDHRAIRSTKQDEYGKKQINPKSEQKTLLRGRSPDFSDGSMLRVHFDFNTGNIRTATPGPKSILDQI
ncbi:terminase large subunit domain-containing protein [Deminuibacter soli]|uniref:terminase large subunit domain-containing protein n=1 Tax=Deminuibacter soli TaxID=2291815 RepID=UPI00131433D6|nr:terminase family protein [Deminuibacter soli]